MCWPPVSVNKVLMKKFGHFCRPTQKTNSILERAQLPIYSSNKPEDILGKLKGDHSSVATVDQREASSQGRISLPKFKPVGMMTMTC